MIKAKKGGKAIKLSHEVIDILESRALEGESYDSVVRAVLKMPPRDGKQSKVKIKTFYILSSPEPAIFKDIANARGEAMVRARMVKLKKAEKPIKVKVKIAKKKKAKHGKV